LVRKLGIQDWPAESSQRHANILKMLICKSWKINLNPGADTAAENILQAKSRPGFPERL
jgi:hypothetical protein